jgi:hypothetical protein
VISRVVEEVKDRASQVADAVESAFDNRGNGGSSSND